MKADVNFNTSFLREEKIYRDSHDFLQNVFQARSENIFPSRNVFRACEEKLYFLSY